MTWLHAAAGGLLAAAWIAFGLFTSPADQSARAAALNAPAKQEVAKPKFDRGLFKDANAFAMTEPPEDRVVTVARGDTMMKILTGNGIDRSEAHAAVTTLGTVFDLRRLQIGQDITLTLQPTDDGHQFLGMALRPTPDRDVLVRLDQGTGGFIAEEIERSLDERDAYASATIETSLYEAALAADMPIDVLMDLVRVFSFDVDFQRDIQSGDRFEVLFDAFDDELGVRVRNGEIRYASMTLSGKTLSYYRFTPNSGITDYFNEKGHSVRKTLMRTPIDGARLSSGFGKRRHPILGYTKMHKGSDFAAPRGTPIMAAGDGVVEKAGRWGAYGKYLRIRHNSSLKTAYAHLNGYARGIKVGARVRQGDIVGYVGTTGRSTGPHLHYEVLVNGRQKNPMSVKLPAGEQLKGNDLKALHALIPTVEQRVAAARAGTEIASSRTAP